MRIGILARTETNICGWHVAYQPIQAVFARAASADVQCDAVVLADGPLGDLAARIRRLTESWFLQLRQMETYEIRFAHRLADCADATEAALICKQWTEHRIDSIMSMQRCLLDLWLDASSQTVTTLLDDKSASSRGKGIRHGG